MGRMNVPVCGLADVKLATGGEAACAAGITIRKIVSTKIIIADFFIDFICYFPSLLYSYTQPGYTIEPRVIE
jgi:hypothetical protein